MAVPNAAAEATSVQKATPPRSVLACRSLRIRSAIILRSRSKPRDAAQARSSSQSDMASSSRLIIFSLYVWTGSLSLAMGAPHSSPRATRQFEPAKQPLQARDEVRSEADVKLATANVRLVPIADSPSAENLSTEHLPRWRSLALIEPIRGPPGLSQSAAGSICRSALRMSAHRDAW